MVPASPSETGPLLDEALRRSHAPRMHDPIWVRTGLLVFALGLLVVFGIALWLDPYHRDGSARTMETHRQVGLPPCSFKFMTGLPCPSCGMTTSFALLMHGDPLHSVQANWVGTLLALFGLALVPWSLASAIRGRPVFIRAIDEALVRVLLVFISLALARWAFVLAWAFWDRLRAA